MPTLLQSNTSFNIDKFRNNFSRHNEVAKADKFSVNIMVPKTILNTDSIQDLSLQCESSELPARDIAMIEFRHYGFIKRIPHMNQYGQASFTFYCAGDMWEKKLFDRWLDLMIPSATGLVTYPLDSNQNPLYECDVFINQFDPMGDMIYQSQLIDAIPTSISPLSQNWSDDSVHRLVVNFSFRKWISDSTNARVLSSDFGLSSGFLANSSIGQIVNGVNNFTNNPQKLLDNRIGAISSSQQSYFSNLLNIF